MHLMTKCLPTSVLLVLVSLSALGGCAAILTPLPEARDQRGLYVDLRKAVELRESSGWIVDDLEVAQAAPSAIESACSAQPWARERLLAWLDAQVLAEGGPAQGIFEAEGDTRRFREVRRIERIRTFLDHLDRIASHECPYWLQPEDDFAGLQTDESRFVLIAETIGGAAMFFQDGGSVLGGGGGARLMPGYGFDERFTVAGGFEVGAFGTLDKDDAGNRAFTGNVALAVPVMLRIRDVSRVYDFEVALTTRWENGEARLPMGVRFGAGIGVSTLRVLNLMPHLVIWVGYEIAPATDTGSAVHTLWLGSRVGFDWAR